MVCKFRPYEGDQPYVFISYCHENDELVSILVNRLYDLGLEIWYDEGINWGKEWDAVVAERLSKSRAVIAFYTWEYMTHVNCVNEAVDALEQKIPLLPVFLEREIHMDPALRMRGGRKNAIRYFEFRDKEQFYKKAMMSSIIAECRNPQRTPLAPEERKTELNPLWPAAKKQAQAEAAQTERSRKVAQERETAPYYCLNCCGKVTEETVLFDMSGLFSEGWELLSFSMTEAELRRLQREGEPIGDGVSQCALSLGEILCVMADEHNCNNPVIAALGREEIQAWLEAGTADGLPGLCDPARMDEAEAAARLRRELAELLNGMDPQGNITFSLELIPEARFDGGEVVTAVMATTAGLGRRMLDKRRCPHCGATLYHRAGAVAHQVITFLGAAGAGKTGVLQAVAHYATQHASFDRGDPLWQGAQRIPQLSTVELLSPRSLAGQQPGSLEEAPASTADLGAAETAITLRIREQQDRQGNIAGETVLTLVELPGTLWDREGNPDRNRILAGYAITMDSSAVVVCQNVYQSGIAMAGREHAVEHARHTGAMADRFQKMITAGSKGESVPMLLLFTDCPDLPQSGREQRMVFPHPVQQLYLLGQERGRMERSSYYKKMLQVFRDATTGSVGYQAELCCRVPGMDARNTRRISDGTAPDVEKPVHIDLLTRWMLAVSGCFEVHTRVGVQGRISRKQYRWENPLFEEGTPTEAVLRCHLFSNPGVYDYALVENLGNKLALMATKVSMKPNANSKN